MAIALLMPLNGATTRKAAAREKACAVARISCQSASCAPSVQQWMGLHGHVLDQAHRRIDMATQREVGCIARARVGGPCGL